MDEAPLGKGGLESVRLSPSLSAREVGVSLSVSLRPPVPPCLPLWALPLDEGEDEHVADRGEGDDEDHDEGHERHDILGRPPQRPHLARLPNSNDK